MFLFIVFRRASFPVELVTPAHSAEKGWPQHHPGDAPNTNPPDRHSALRHIGGPVARPVITSPVCDTLYRFLCPLRRYIVWVLYFYVPSPSSQHRFERNGAIYSLGLGTSAQPGQYLRTAVYFHNLPLVLWACLREVFRALWGISVSS